MTDHELMLAVRNGEIEKLGIIFENHYKRLYNFFNFQVKNRHASEDLVQNVFLRILKYRHTYRDDGDFRVWMYKIARNVYMDYLKNKIRVNKSDEINDMEDPSQDIEKEFEIENDITVLRKAMDRLPPDKKEMLIMSRFNGMSYKEIGQISGCSEGAVKVRIFRALEELSKIYFQLTGEINELRKN